MNTSSYDLFKQINKQLSILVRLNKNVWRFKSILIKICYVYFVYAYDSSFSRIIVTKDELIIWNFKVKHLLIV